MNNISAWAIRNPVPTIVLFLLLAIAGIAGWRALPIANLPNIDAPIVTVTVVQAGASPTEIEQTATRVIEEAVANLTDVKHIYSTVADGVSTTTVEFALGTTPDRATSDVRDAVAKARVLLPADIDDPAVVRADPGGGAILTYALASHTVNEEQLSALVDNELAKLLTAAPGVARIRRIGGVEREIQVGLDPDRLLALDTTVGEVSRALKAANADIPAGRGSLGAHEVTIRTAGAVRSISELANLPLSLAAGRSVRLGDLGSVRDGTTEKRSLARLDGAPVVAFDVFRSAQASEPSVFRAVETRLGEFAAAHPDVAVRCVASTVRFTEAAFDASIEALLLGGLLAIVVIWAFLRDMRATLISVVAIPLSVLPTLAVLAALGFSLNNLSLIALALVMGVLVDDAIVEIENIARHVGMGKRPYEAALDAADEIGPAVVATTLTIVAVFLPVGLMGGVPGQFFRQFGITVAVAVLFSLAVARLLTPLMSAYLLAPRAPRAPRADRLTAAYARFLDCSLRHRTVTLVTGIALFLASLALVPLLPTGFIPVADRGRSVLTIDVAPGSPLAELDAAIIAATRILQSRPEVKSVFAMVREGDRAIVTANLTPRRERALSQQDFERDVGPAMRGIPGVRVAFGGDGRNTAKLSVRLASDDLSALEQAALRLEREMRTVPGLVNVSSSVSLRRPELAVRPNVERAARLGVAAEQIAQTVRIATIGDADAALPKLSLGDRQVPIRVKLDEQARGDLRALDSLKVIGTGGTRVRLGSVAELHLETVIARIERVDRTRVASVTADVAGVPLGAALENIHALPIFRDMPPRVRELAGGDAEQLAELFDEFGTALTGGVVLVFAVLVLLFGDFLQPLTIMVALPLAIGGALGLLLLSHEALSLPALIGLLMLLGIVTKNSILLVDFALSAMRQGVDRRAALLAAASTRARPIVMTTLAMMAGMAPIALRIGADAEFRAPMAIAVIGGLATSTLLSLLYVPAVFTVVDDVRRWLARRFAIGATLRPAGRRA